MFKKEEVNLKMLEREIKKGKLCSLRKRRELRKDQKY